MTSKIPVIVFLVLLLSTLPVTIVADEVAPYSGNYSDRVAIFIEPTATEVEQMQKDWRNRGREK